MNTPLYIFGAGGHAKCVIEAARLSNLQPSAVLDDHPRVDSLCGLHVFRAADFPLAKPFRFIVAIGNCAIRRQKYELLLAAGGQPQTVIHPRAYVSPSAQIGEGSVLLHFSTVDADSIIGENCILNIGSIVGHDCRVDDHSHISANVAIGGGCHIKQGSWLSLGASIKEGVTIGEESFVGLGGMISHNVAPHKKAICPNRREFVVMDR